MADVVGLRGQVVHDGREPRQEVVDYAKWLLEAAQSGEVVGIAAISQYADTACGQTIVGIVSYSMAGRLASVQAKVIALMEAD